MQNSKEKEVTVQNDNVSNKVKLDKYHSMEYLKKNSKGKKIRYILPNGKEVEINE